MTQSHDPLKTSGWRIELSTTEDSEPAQKIHRTLKAEVEAEVGPSDRKALILSAHDESGELRGGLRGYSHWKWLYISHLWVDIGARAHGLGARLMMRAEDEARAQGLMGLYVDTFSPRAARFYEKNGFVETGRIQDFPPGRSRIILSKRLS